MFIIQALGYPPKYSDYEEHDKKEILDDLATVLLEEMV
jgi:hypothetical protein